MEEERGSRNAEDESVTRIGCWFRDGPVPDAGCFSVMNGALPAGFG